MNQHLMASNSGGSKGSTNGFKSAQKLKNKIGAPPQMLLTGSTHLGSNSLNRNASVGVL